ncbi:MAG: response regulator transcription factor [Anaerolineae bacterium]|nr:response regulator transcription factor [Anaerolineae bacterium]
MTERQTLTTPSSFPNARLLIADDEEALRRSMDGLFKRLGYQVTTAASGQEALNLINTHPFDLVILDLNMPGINGDEVLKVARPTAPHTIFIILTGYGTLDSAITGIRHGAFDYLLKPTPIQDIVRAVEAGLTERQRRLGQEDPVALLERALSTLKSADTPSPPTPPPQKRFLQVYGITMDLTRQLVVLDGEPVTLTATEFDILSYMIEHSERVIACSELVRHLRGCEMDERDARVFVRSHIHRLRQKLERDPAHPALIHSVRGSGYILTARPPSK